jgi:hypothetical protein
VTVKTLNTSPRETTEAQKLWVSSQPFWHAPQFPIEHLPPKRRGQRRNCGQTWFQNLKTDIDMHGLRSPILLNYSDVDAELNPFPERPDYCLNAGNHRLMAAMLLGWETIPAIVWGKHPDCTHCTGPYDLTAVNDTLVKDGAIHLCWHGPVLTGASDARKEFA